MLDCGVEHHDVRPPIHVLWNPEIRNVVLVDFERLEILGTCSCCSHFKVTRIIDVAFQMNCFLGNHQQILDVSFVVECRDSSKPAGNEIYLYKVWGVETPLAAA